MVSKWERKWIREEVMKEDPELSEVVFTNCRQPNKCGGIKKVGNQEQRKRKQFRNFLHYFCGLTTDLRVGLSKKTDYVC